LILASTSPYRRTLLARLTPEFEAISPGVDEGRRRNEEAGHLVARLAKEKAEAVAARHPEAVVIGADQAAVTESGAILGKPGSRVGAIAQLAGLSGTTVRFLSAVHVVGPIGEEGWIVPTEVDFRTLELDEIKRYVDRDEPFDCAGGFKIESLGVALMERVVQDDPTALEGLPLISLAAALRRQGLTIP